MACAAASARNQQGCFRHAVGREDRVSPEAVAGEGRDETIDGFGMHWLGTVERDLPAGEIDVLHLVGAIPADAVIIAEVRTAADLGSIIMDCAQPVQGPLREGVRGHQYAERSDIERL